MGESGRAGQEKGSLISTFPFFLAAIVGVRFLEGEGGLGAGYPPKFEIFLIFSFF